MGISTTTARKLMPAMARQAAPLESRAIRTIGKELEAIASRAAGPQTFRSAAGRLDALSSALTRTGLADDARILTETARRLTHAGELHASGHTQAAFEMLHARRKLGLANPEFQAALARGSRAEGLLARFGTRTAAEKAFDRAASRVDDLAEKLIRTGNPGEARVLESFATRLNRAGDLHAEGHRQAAFSMLHAKRKPGLAGQEVQTALAKAHRAESLLETFGDATTLTRAVPRKPTPAVTRPVAPRPPVARPELPLDPGRTADKASRTFSMPGAGLDLSGLVRYLDRLKAWFLGR